MGQQDALFVKVKENSFKFDEDMDFAVTKDTHPIDYSTEQFPQPSFKPLQFALTHLLQICSRTVKLRWSEMI